MKYFCLLRSFVSSAESRVGRAYLGRHLCRLQCAYTAQAEIIRAVGNSAINSTNYISAVPTTTSVTNCSESNELLTVMSQVIHNDDFDQVILHPVFSECIKKLHDFNDDDLLQLTRLLSQIKDKFGRALYDFDEVLIAVGRAIDEELCERYFSIEQDRILEFSSAILCLPKQRYSFSIRLIKSQLKKSLKWPTPRMIEFIKLLDGLNVWFAYHIDKYSIEYATMRHLPFLSVNDLGVMVHVMTKLNVTVNTPNLLQDIFDKFVREFPSHDEALRRKFFLFFRMQPKTYYWANEGDTRLKQLVTLLNENANSFSLPTLITAAELLTSLNCYDRTFFARFASRFVDEVDFPINDIVAGVFALVYFDVKCEYHKLLQKIKTEPLNLLRNRPKKLIHILHYLSKVGIYDYELLDIVFSTSFLSDTYNKLSRNYVPLDVFSLNESVVLECPDYLGRQLPPSLKLSFRSRYSIRFVSELFPVASLENGDNEKYFLASHHEKLVFDIQLTLASLLGGQEYIRVFYPLLYLNRVSLVFCLKDGIAQSLEGVMMPEPGQKVDECGPGTWYSLEFLVRNTMPGTDELLRVYNAVVQSRHMKKLGYHLLPIDVHLWKKLSADERREYLEKLIFVK